MYKIGIIEKFHEEGFKLLKNNSNFEYEIIEDISEKNLISTLPNFDGLTVRLTELNEKVLSSCTKLKVISRHGVGYNSIDTSYLKKNNITLCITSTANATAVAEHVMYMMLTISKGLNVYDKEVRNGNFKKNLNLIKTFELYEKEILIAGFGRIGKNLVKRCKGFDMKINVFDPFVDEEEIKKYGASKVKNLNGSLFSADYVSLHMPLTAETKNMINYDLLKKMKKTAIIINTARGGIINENDIDKALKEGLIFGAGIDVFEEEPLNENNPLIKNNKVLLSPHAATFTEECKKRMSIETIKNVIDFFEKKLDKSMTINL